MFASNNLNDNASSRDHKFAADLADAQFADNSHQDYLDEEFAFDAYEEFGLGRRHNQALY